MYDYVQSDDNTFLIICRNEHFKVEFDGDNQREMFTMFIKTPQKRYGKLIKKLKKDILNQRFCLFSKI